MKIHKILFLAFVLLTVNSCRQRNIVLNTQGVAASASLPSVFGPQMADAYDRSDWNAILLMADSIKRGGEPIDDMVLLYAKALEETGSPERAVEVLTASLAEQTSITPRYYLYHELGSAYSALKDYENAVAAYKAALTLQPSYARPMVGLGQALAESGDIESAMYYYSLASNLFDENEMADELLAIGSAMVNIAPDDPNGWQTLANGFDYLGQYEKEEECLNNKAAIFLKDKSFFSDESKMQDFLMLNLQMAVTCFHMERYQDCLKYIDVIHENSTTMGDYDEIVTHLYEESKIKLN